MPFSLWKSLVFQPTFMRLLLLMSQMEPLSSVFQNSDIDPPGICSRSYHLYEASSLLPSFLVTWLHQKILVSLFSFVTLIELVHVLINMQFTHEFFHTEPRVSIKKRLCLTQFWVPYIWFCTSHRKDSIDASWRE